MPTASSASPEVPTESLSNEPGDRSEVKPIVKLEPNCSTVRESDIDQPVGKTGATSKLDQCGDKEPKNDGGSDKTSEVPIIPTSPSQLILSSVITSTSANVSASSNTTVGSTINTTTTTTTTPAKTTLAPKASKQQASKTVPCQNGSSKVNPSHSTPSLPHGQAIRGSQIFVVANRSSEQSQTQISSLSTSVAPKASSSALSPATPAGQAVNARLMDMGKQLLEATRQGQTEKVRQLVSSGAPFTSDWLGTTALHMAAQREHGEIADILLRGGVNRDARTKLERTALHVAAQSGSFEVVDLLLIHGSDVNARDMLKMAPLHWAVERGHKRVAERLLSEGADANAVSKFHLTPIDIAQNSGKYEMLDLFKGWLPQVDDTLSPPKIKNLIESYDLDVGSDIINHQNQNLTESCSLSSNMIKNYDLDVKYSMVLDDSANLSRASMFDIDEQCIDLVELEWKLDPELFLSPDEDEDELEEESGDRNDGEPKVEYLMKILGELQRENQRLRQKVEQLSTSPNTSSSTSTTMSQ